MGSKKKEEDIKIEDIKIGDHVIVLFGYDYTEHVVLKIVGNLVNIDPSRRCLGYWAPLDRIKGFYTPAAHPAPPKEGFFTRFRNWLE